MDCNEYQLKAHSFASYNELYSKNNNGEFTKTNFTYPVLGLTEEAGEVAGKFAKIIRDDNCIISVEKKESIIKELGDVMWMVSEIATLLNVSLVEIMQKNIDKLTSRKERGVIGGSGDDR